MYLRLPEKEDLDLVAKMFNHSSSSDNMIDEHDALTNFSYYPFKILTKNIGGTIEEPVSLTFKSSYDKSLRKLVAILEDEKLFDSNYPAWFISNASEVLKNGTVEKELETGEKIVSYGKGFKQVISNYELEFLNICGPDAWKDTGRKMPIAIDNKTGVITSATVVRNELTGKNYIALKCSEDGHLVDVNPADINYTNVINKNIILCEEKDIRWLVDGDKAIALSSTLLTNLFSDYTNSPLKALLASPEYQASLGFEPTIEKAKTRNPFTVGKLTLDQQLKKSLKIGVIPFLVGPPGIGKTEIIESQSKHVKTYIMSTWSPTSFTGKDYVIPADVITTVDENGNKITHTERALTGRAKPEWLTDIERELELAKEDGEDVILFLDEFDKLTPDLQVFVNGIISNKPTLGGWPVPEGVKIVLAGNTTVDSLASNKISSEVSSRLMTIKVKPDVEEWLKWAVKNNIDPLIIAYIKNNKSDLLTVEKGPDGRVNPELSMNPRKWVKMVNKGIIESRVTGEPLMINNYMTEAQVEKFMNFINQYYDNRIDDILDGTAPLYVTDDIGQNSFVLTTLSTIARVDQLKNVLPFIKNKEYRIFFLRNWLNYHPDNKTEVYEIMQEISLDEESVEHGIKV